jgi:hypothetical protein
VTDDKLLDDKLLKDMLADAKWDATNILRYLRGDGYAAQLAERALNDVRRILTGDMVAAIMLGEQLADLRKYGERASLVGRIRRSRRLPWKTRQIIERKKAYEAAIKRGLSPTKAYVAAGRALDISAKTIRRAVKGQTVNT